MKEHRDGNESVGQLQKQELEHEFSEELSDGGERNEMAEKQQQDPSRRKRIRTG
ncbi:hypothetical protein [Halalkalibacter okhensis]|uniref:hypothetical protein n=1 Tax=Halalkalibacter okhensis TaxID=333138 RepID=UPI000AE06677|nr:hypothetical protein [Halalkalibacter okhensis]